jgi:pectinesterase
MENMTVRNPATQAQAVALYQTRDRQTLKNCRIIGNQDTHRTKKGRRFFYYKTFIEGSVDFIYSGGTCYFYQCTINSNRNGYITAPEDITYFVNMSLGRTLRYGFFFKDCDLTANAGVAAGSVTLGRPWNIECGSVFLNCRLGNHISNAGWTAWNENELSACFGEYKSMNADGTALANVAGRVSWSKQFTTEEVNQYMMLSHIYAAVQATAYDPVSMVIGPSPVSALTVDGQALSWEAVSNARGYVVYADHSAIGFTTTGSYTDTVARSNTPVYNVRTVGPLGNLSLRDGETDTITTDSINGVINTPITSISSPSISAPSLVVRDHFLFFSQATDFTLYTLSGHVVTTCRQLKSFNLETLPRGIYLIRATDEVNGNYSARIQH